MSDKTLSQRDADRLIEMDKGREDEETYLLPLSGRLTVPLVAWDKSEFFSLDIRKSRIDLLKGRVQLRGRQIIVLVRLDFGGHPHRNPDDEEIPSPHLHLYREGYGDKWAIPLPQEYFTKPGDLWMTLNEFMRYTHVTEPPHFNRGLFS